MYQSAQIRVTFFPRVDERGAVISLSFFFFCHTVKIFTYRRFLVYATDEDGHGKRTCSHFSHDTLFGALPTPRPKAGHTGIRGEIVWSRKKGHRLGFVLSRDRKMTKMEKRDGKSRYC